MNNEFNYVIIFFFYKSVAMHMRYAGIFGGRWDVKLATFEV